jgi:hypothetical protein
LTTFSTARTRRCGAANAGPSSRTAVSNTLVGSARLGPGHHGSHSDTTSPPSTAREPLPPQATSIPGLGESSGHTAASELASVTPKPSPYHAPEIGLGSLPLEVRRRHETGFAALPDAPRYASAGKDSRSRPVMPLPPGLSPVGAGRLALWLLSRRSQRAARRRAQRSQTGFGIHRHEAIVLSV